MSLRPSGGDCTITLDGSRVFLESVAANRHYICTTSMNNGAVDRGRAGAKTLAPFLPGDTDGRTQASGIKLDGDRLLVSGGYTARFFSIPTAASSCLPAASREPARRRSSTMRPWSNGDVYVTDSFRPVLHRIPATEVNAAPTGAHRTLQVADDLPHYVAGQSTGNGIVAAANGKSLIIGYWYSGALYRLTLATSEIHKITAPALHSADGIVRRGTPSTSRAPSTTRSPPCASTATTRGPKWSLSAPTQESTRRLASP
jgi:hypothetical protein